MFEWNDIWFNSFCLELGLEFSKPTWLQHGAQMEWNMNHFTSWSETWCNLPTPFLKHFSLCHKHLKFLGDCSKVNEQVNEQSIMFTIHTMIFDVYKSKHRKLLYVLITHPSPSQGDRCSKPIRSLAEVTIECVRWVLIHEGSWKSIWLIDTRAQDLTTRHTNGLRKEDCVIDSNLDGNTRRLIVKKQRIWWCKLRKL